ncbi:MAG TPA: hypothetical protein VGN97_18290 [Mesorhizobium sp.]|nr:hypothetical protein [Mesorhizobium sp.]
MAQKSILLAGLMAAAAGLSACQQTRVIEGNDGGGTGRTVAARPTGVEGSWQDNTGGVSTLSGGAFQTVASDTGEKLSEGRYTLTGADSVAISGTSLARQRRNQPADIAFNCLLASVNQLNCTSSSGQQFILTRRGATA